MPRFVVRVTIERSRQAKNGLEAAWIPTISPAYAEFVGSPESEVVGDSVTAVIEAGAKTPLSIECVKSLTSAANSGRLNRTDSLNRPDGENRVEAAAPASLRFLPAFLSSCCQCH